MAGKGEAYSHYGKALRTKLAWEVLANSFIQRTNLITLYLESATRGAGAVHRSDSRVIEISTGRTAWFLRAIADP